MREQLIDMCVALAWILWRGMDPDYKRKYARVIWDQFQARLAGEAQTCATLGEYVNALSDKLGVQALGLTEDLDILDSTLNSGKDREILRMMREETALIVVKVRLMNELYREEREAAWRERDPIAQEEELKEAWNSVQE